MRRAPWSWIAGFGVLAVLVGSPVLLVGLTDRVAAGTEPALASALPPTLRVAGELATRSSWLLPKLLAAGPATVGRARGSVVRFRIGGLPRELIEIAPTHPKGPLPLVIVLHGRRQTAWRAENTQRWSTLAGTDRAIVAYGAGYAGSWNAGSCCGPALAHHVDDMGYLLEVVRQERARHAVDPQRIYLVGFSNGGMLAYRFACAHADLLAAVAVVGASRQVPVCRPARPVSVLAISGGRDGIVPFQGSRFSRVAGAPTLSVPQSLRPWRLADRGSAARVQVVRLPRLAHAWPTVADSGYDGTDQIWRFLSAYSAITDRTAGPVRAG